MAIMPIRSGREAPLTDLATPWNAGTAILELENGVGACWDEHAPLASTARDGHVDGRRRTGRNGLPCAISHRDRVDHPQSGGGDHRRQYKGTFSRE